VVLVYSRSGAGAQTLWRVGRHRLAWRPSRRPGLHPYDPFRDRYDELAELVSWLAAVPATLVVLPWRALSNRWPVVAYQLVPMDQPGRPVRSRSLPRGEADELVRTWAAYIESHGELPKP
jgi:hypothetical protein